MAIVHFALRNKTRLAALRVKDFSKRELVEAKLDDTEDVSDLLAKLEDSVKRRQQERAAKKTPARK